MSLIVPTHVARRRARNGNGGIPAQIQLDKPFEMPSVLNKRMQSDEEFIADLQTAVDTGKLRVPLWKIVTTPVNQRSITRGGILLSDETVDMQDWTHQLHKIVLVGPHVYKGPQYRDYDIAPEEFPQVGQLWTIDPKQPRRLRFKDRLLILINDDQLGLQVDATDVEHISFNGLGL